MEKAASMPIDEVFKDLKTSTSGLTSEEAKLRLKKYGQNKLSEGKARKRTDGRKFDVEIFLGKIRLQGQDCVLVH